MSSAKAERGLLRSCHRAVRYEIDEGISPATDALCASVIVHLIAANTWCFREINEVFLGLQLRL